MSDEEELTVDQGDKIIDESEPQKKTVLIRIEEWMAWLPQRPDGQLWMSSGVTGFEAFENEKVLEVAVTSAGKQQFIPMENPEDPDQPLNVRHGLYAFQAVLASNFDGPLPEGPRPGKESPLVMPGQKNREQRRRGKK